MSIIRDMRTKRFWRRYRTSVLTVAGGFATGMQVAIILWPKLVTPFQSWELPTLIGLMCLLGGLRLSWPRPILVQFEHPSTVIKVIEGDLLAQSSHLVIGVCDTFDTETPNIIANSSLVGQVVNRIYGGDFKRLDRDITAALEHTTPSTSIVKVGHTEVYPMGTTASIPNNDRLLFLLAYASMDKANNAMSTVDDIWGSMRTLWETISLKGNHKTVSMPVLGGGLSRVSSIMAQQESIKLTILSFMFASREKKITEELVIVVQPKDFDRLDHLELQSFLSALRPS